MCSSFKFRVSVKVKWKVYAKTANHKSIDKLKDDRLVGICDLKFLSFAAVICEDEKILCLGDEIFLIVFFCAFANIWFMAFEVMKGPTSYANSGANNAVQIDSKKEIDFRVNHLENLFFFFSSFSSFAFAFHSLVKRKKSFQLFEVKMCRAHEVKKSRAYCQKWKSGRKHQNFGDSRTRERTLWRRRRAGGKFEE